MKKQLLILPLLVGVLHAEFSFTEMAQKALSDAKEYITIERAKEVYKTADSYIRERIAKGDEGNSTNATTQRIERTGGHLKFPINYNTLFSKKNCDRVLQNEAYMSCYDDNYKGSKLLTYTLTADNLKSQYIQREDGNHFYEDRRLPRGVRAYSRDYVHSGYDRGHLRPYASSAYSQKFIDQTYSMVNVLPQTPELNRHRWVKAEKYERLMARKLGNVEVLSIALYDKNPKRIGKHKVAVPKAFYKIITSSNRFKRCFYYENTARKIKGDKLKDHEVSCDRVYY